MTLSPLQLLNRCQTVIHLKYVHASLLIEGSYSSSDLILNKLIRLYSRFGSIDYAHKVFDSIPEPNPYIWTALLHGYIENRRYPDAFSLFRRMRKEGVPPLNFTLSSLMKGLARQERLEDGGATLGLVLKCGFGYDNMVQNAVIDFFMRCGELVYAGRVFDEMEERDIISWNSMLSGYANNCRADDARELFDKMPDKNVISWTSMISAYIKVKDLISARILFEAMPDKDLASWNVMISGYIDNCDIENARLIFERMHVQDTGTWNMMLSGFCKIGYLDSAEEFFSRMQKKNTMSWNIMINGYVKAGEMDKASVLFDQMPQKNLVSWSTMISGYAKNGQPHAALHLFRLFKDEGIKPDESFILGMISACSQLGILQTGESVLGSFSLFETGHLPNLQVITAVIDMYAKCGSISKALETFRTAYRKDLICYSTMISAFANHGLGKEAINLFNEMVDSKIRPDGAIFLALLSSCNHGGMIDEGKQLFKQMTDDFRIHHNEKHYACMVDLLGRSGCLKDAYNLIKIMPMVPGRAVWGALLAACRAHSNVELAEVAAKELFKIEPRNSGNYTLLSNVYASARRWDGVAKVRAMIRENRVRKNRGSSWIELDSVVYEFVMSDESHLNSDDIYSTLDLLLKHIVCDGYELDEFGLDKDVHLG